MSRFSIIALVVFIALTGVVLSLRLPAARRIQSDVLVVVKPFHTTINDVGKGVASFGKGLKTLEELERDNAALKLENEELRATNGMLKDLAEQNDSLRQALEFKKRSNFNLLPARIIARSTATWWSSVQIDRGEQDGLDTDMPVVTDVGLVGKTTTVAATTSYVVLIADENCKVAATVESTRETGILSGDRASGATQPDLILSYLSKTAPLQAGQKVYSAGVSGGVFPAGLLLGTIKEFQVRALDARAVVTPAVDLSRLESVFIVRGTRNPAGPGVPVRP
jgi:rod shape-determining protein MreC